MSEGQEAVPVRPYEYHSVPDWAEDQTAEAFYVCFTGASGRIVLDTLYWRVMMAHPEDLRAVGKQDLFRELVDMMHKGAVVQRQRYAQPTQEA